MDVISLSHSAFAGLSSNGRDQLQQLSRRQFAPGDPLSLAGVIPSEILLISSGTARLLVRDQGRLRTAEKLGAGSFVGLASLLRAAPCEEVSAGTELEAWVLPDALTLHLLGTEPAFAQWCAAELFTAELAALLSLLLDQHPQANSSLLPLIEQARSEGRLVPPEPAALAALTADLSLLAASHNLPDHPLGALLDPSLGLPCPRF
jgi:ATP-binding cassette subfamily B protein